MVTFMMSQVAKHGVAHRTTPKEKDEG